MIKSIIMAIILSSTVFCENYSPIDYGTLYDYSGMYDYSITPDTVNNNVDTYDAGYNMAPDGSYVGGSSNTLAPDGSYVSGDSFTLTPDGSYVGN